MQKIFFNDEDVKYDEEITLGFLQIVFLLTKVVPFQKGVFTYCQFRENEKCPPWELRAKKIHITAKKLFIMIMQF